MLLVGMLVLSACQGDAREPEEVPGGDPEAGKELIIAYDCGACHNIPGVEGADGRTAPGLHVWPNRAFVAGRLDNNPENVIRFIKDPQEVRPGIDMPDLGLTEEEARHITAYLFTLG